MKAVTQHESVVTYKYKIMFNIPNTQVHTVKLLS